MGRKPNNFFAFQAKNVVPIFSLDLAMFGIFSVVKDISEIFMIVSNLFYFALCFGLSSFNTTINL